MEWEERPARRSSVDIEARNAAMSSGERMELERKRREEGREGGREGGGEGSLTPKHATRAPGHRGSAVASSPAAHAQR